MINRILGYFAAGGLILLAVWYVLAGERKKARQAQQLATFKRVHGNVKKAKEAEERVNNQSDAARRDSLRKHSDK